jgi:hypothetical protein
LAEGLEALQAALAQERGEQVLVEQEQEQEQELARELALAVVERVQEALEVEQEGHKGLVNFCY